MINKIIRGLRTFLESNVDVDELDPGYQPKTVNPESLRESENERKVVENRIKRLEVEKEEIKKKGYIPYNFVSFSISILITLGLTLYLFVFYSSTVYSAFYGSVDSNLGGFIRASVFTEAASKGTGATSIIILAPFIFIGLGFLIHHALKENRLLTIRKRPRKYGLISLLILMTFLFDSLMGYKIAESIHNDLYMKGFTDLQWAYHLVLIDINFWLVLFSGFVVYIIWGLLLDKVMQDYENTHPEEVIKKIDMELEVLQNEIHKI